MEPASPPLILASASPRRRELLADAGLRFTVVAPDVEEEALPNEAPDGLVLRLAQAKAAAVAGSPGAVLLAADTVVALERRILGKPRDPAEARTMLQALSGSAHQVWTGVAIRGPGAVERFVVRTEVRFRPLTAAEIDWYVASGEPMDKAGAYGIQGKAASFVLSIDGSYTNVVGLPLAETLLALRGLGIAPG